MASAPLNVSDFAGALASGALPAALSADRTELAFPPVVSEGAGGKRLWWRIRVRLLAGGGAGPPLPIEPPFLAPGGVVPPGAVGEYLSESRQGAPGGAPGKLREGGKPTLVAQGKNLGKANATNPLTQAIRDALGLYNKRLRAPGAALEAAPGPGGPAPAAAPPGTPAPAAPPRPPPMLVKKAGETREATLTPRDFEQGVTVQRKFNGVRAVAFLEEGGEGARFYSRTGLDYPVGAGLAGEAGALLRGRPAGAPALYLDGELYKHGKPLRWISGQARRALDEGGLDYVVYDCFFPGEKAAGRDAPGAERQAALGALFGGWARFGRVARAENFPAASMAEAEALRDRFLGEGYEGAIARKDGAPYRYGIGGYHSANLVKLKPVLDSEFEVVGFAQGTRGKDVGAVIWVCRVPPGGPGGGQTFQVAPKDMSYEERYRVFRALGEEVEDDRPGAPPGARATRFERDFRGHPLTVEYPELSTKTGKPTQAKALAFRTYEGGPGRDPVRRLYEEAPPP